MQPARIVEVGETSAGIVVPETEGFRFFSAHPDFHTLEGTGVPQPAPRHPGGAGSARPPARPAPRRLSPADHPEGRGRPSGAAPRVVLDQLRSAAPPPSAVAGEQQDPADPDRQHQDADRGEGRGAVLHQPRGELGGEGRHHEADRDPAAARSMPRVSLSMPLSSISTVTRPA